MQQLSADASFLPIEDSRVTAHTGRLMILDRSAAEDRGTPTRSASTTRAGCRMWPVTGVRYGIHGEEVAATVSVHPGSELAPKALRDYVKAVDLPSTR